LGNRKGDVGGGFSMSHPIALRCMEREPVNEK
jgi:hypothetical protein